jgi:hypothetical protein
MPQCPNPHRSERRLLPWLGAMAQFAFNDRCDAVVATALVAHPHPAPIEPSVSAFLNSKTVVQWAEVTLGL